MAQSAYGFHSVGGGFAPNLSWSAPSNPTTPRYALNSGSVGPPGNIFSGEGVCGLCTCSSMKGPKVDVGGGHLHVQDPSYMYSCANIDDRDQGSSKLSAVLWFILGVLVVAGIVYALVTFAPGSLTESTTSLESSVATPMLQYDCDAGVKHWKLGWADAKKNWCCGKVGVGCEAS